MPSAGSQVTVLYQEGREGLTGSCPWDIPVQVSIQLLHADMRWTYGTLIAPTRRHADRVGGAELSVCLVNLVSLSCWVTEITTQDKRL